jgi:pimeloyl-ACP methyl ester carboxylesterase
MTGLAYDMALIAKPWGFEPAAITTKVSVWQGDMDTNTPPAMGHYLADTIPACRKHILAGRGHFLTFTHASDILRTLTDNN